MISIWTSVTMIWNSLFILVWKESIRTCSVSRSTFGQIRIKQAISIRSFFIILRSGSSHIYITIPTVAFTTYSIVVFIKPIWITSGYYEITFRDVIAIEILVSIIIV